MNVFYEEEGALKVGAVLADNATSLQVEAPHGKRSKIKSSAVLLRFEQPPITDFMAQAQAVADEQELDFLWECAGADEFGYETLAREYFGRAPNAVQAAGILLKLHAAPMYFYKRGRGRYKAAPPDALKAALASVERKKQQALAREAYIKQLGAGRLPPEFEPLLDTLLFKPDKNSVEWKALEDASAAARSSPVRVIERCGGIASTHDYHLKRFIFEHFPRGVQAPAVTPESVHDLPLSDAIAFSIDDASTTEIDDAFSVTPLTSGNVRIGIHIAAPALGMPVAGALDEIARSRLSTVYYPGGKITMLPTAAIEGYTLQAGCECPALSLYVEVTPDDVIVGTETRVERVHIAENLRLEALEPLFNADTLLQGPIDHALGVALSRLWQWVLRLESARRGDQPEGEQRPEYSFRIENDKVEIVRRPRGTPIDKLVSELMIYVNSTWARELAGREMGAIYRVQGGGKVRMSTAPAAHVGLGVEHYAWASSPLRRYIDLANQRQLIAIATETPTPYKQGDAHLLAIMREFESAHDAYSEFQRSMERYWCLRWLQQEQVSIIEATILREDLCRFDTLPIVARVPSIPALQSGARVVLAISDIDLLELTLHCEFKHALDAQPAPERLVDDITSASAIL
ncbi:MAG TPA: RNB domain-containing ribonuclease [Burkholderiales bacterium]|nr:RNB domain-containing ribonuclease [Burkholderiales bacterium]